MDGKHEQLTLTMPREMWEEIAEMAQMIEDDPHGEWVDVLWRLRVRGRC